MEKDYEFWRNNKDKNKEGWDAYWNGVDKEDCPYKEFSSDYVAWRDGWREAQDSDVRFPTGGYEYEG